MSDKKIKIIELDDWIQIYINGVIRYQNHSISGTKMLDLLGIKYDYEYIEDVEI